jgi:hypothetical protein
MPSGQEIKEKLAKLKMNKRRLELRKIQVTARALALDSKIEGNRAEIMKITCSAELQLPVSDAVGKTTASAE